MPSDLQQHKLAYFILALIIILFVTSFLVLWPNRFWLKISVITFMASYFLWGILVHRKAGHVNREIVKEYGLVSLVGGIVLLMLTN